MTPSQAEIVKRFLAGETLNGFLIGGHEALAEAGAALRAALVEKDAELHEARTMLAVIAAYDPVEEPFDIVRYARENIAPWLEKDSP